MKWPPSQAPAEAAADADTTALLSMRTSVVEPLFCCVCSCAQVASMCGVCLCAVCTVRWRHTLLLTLLFPDM